MTQKQFIANILRSMDFKLARYVFIIDWLEDINWHTECSMINNLMEPEEAKKVDLLREFDYALRPSNYSSAFINDIKNDLVKYNEACELYNKPFYNGYVSLGEYSFSKDQLYSFHNAIDFYKGMNYGFGWGLITSEWKAIQGQEFVDELVDLINNPDQYCD